MIWKFTFSNNWQYKFANFSIKMPDGSPGELVPTKEGANYFTTFEYQWPTGFTTINLQALNLFAGFLYPSPAYIALNGPQNWNPVDPVDQHFLSVISQALKGFAHPQWSEGKNPFLDLINQTTGKNYTDNPDEVNMTEIPETEVLPLPRGITISQSSTIDIIGPYPGDVPSYMKSILRIFENAAKPLIENNTLDYYRVYSKSGEDRVVMSQRGQQEENERVDKDTLHIGYWKYVADVSLRTFPLCRKKLEWLLGSYKDIPPLNKPVDLRTSDIVKYKTDATGSHIIQQINDAMLNANGERLAELENILRASETYKVDLESLFYHLETTEPEKMELYMSPDWVTPNYQNFLKEIGYGAYAEQFMDIAQKEMIMGIQSGDRRYLRKWEKVINHLNLPPELIQRFNQLSEQHRQEQLKIEQEREAQRRLASFNFVWDRAVIDLSDPAAHVEDISKYDSLAEYLVAERKYSDGDLEAAYEQASENAAADIISRPSENYPESEKELMDDIAYESDDFLQSIGFWSSDTGIALWKKDNLEELSKDYKSMGEYETKLIYERMKDKFIQWKIKQLREEEDQESWKYESEDADLDSIVYGDPYHGQDGILYEIVEQGAYESGLMYMATDRHIDDWMEVHVHSKFKKQAQAALKTFAVQNKPSDNWDDPGLPKNFKIDVTFEDTNTGYEITIYDLLRNRTASGRWRCKFG